MVRQDLLYIPVSEVPAKANPLYKHCIIAPLLSGNSREPKYGAFFYSAKNVLKT